MPDRYGETPSDALRASGAYEGAIDRVCPLCGAARGQQCTFQTYDETARTVTRRRHHPCIARTKTPYCRRCGIPHDDECKRQEGT